MLNIKSTFKENTQAIKRLIDGFNFVRSMEVVVGITDETDVTRENGITNSQLLYLHEQGVPSKNIPPRPVLKPALEKDGAKKKMRKLIRDGMKEAMIHGDLTKARQCYEKAGMVGRDATKKYITDGNNLAPNAPSTIKKKGSSLPLVDTSSMLNSITYAVRKK